MLGEGGGGGESMGGGMGGASVMPDVAGGERGWGLLLAG
jgi:hypothetical protein